MNKPHTLTLRILTCLVGSVALAALLLVVLHTGLVSAQGGGTLTRVTVAGEANRMSSFPKISADGTKIIFDSDADFFNEGIPDNQFHIWLYDTSTLSMTRISPLHNLTNCDFDHDIDGAGTKVVLCSDFDIFGQGIADNQYEIWMYDVTAMTYTRITTASASDRDSFNPKISANGTKIVFISNSDFFNQGIPASQYELWLYNTTTQALTRITTSSPGSSNGAGDSIYALDISDDGTRIAFGSNVDFFNQGAVSSSREVWFYNTTTMTYTRITSASNQFRRIGNLSISGDGTKVAFISDSDYLGQGIPENQLELWLYDTATMTLTRVTNATDNNRFTFHPSLNVDGSKLAFMSTADLLGQDIPPGQSEIWLYDTEIMTYTRITTSTGNNSPASEAPAISADGSTIAFMSTADFFDQGDIGELQKEIWLYELPPVELLPKRKVYLPLVLK